MYYRVWIPGVLKEGCRDFGLGGFWGLRDFGLRGKGSLDFGLRRV